MGGQSRPADLARMLRHADLALFRRLAAAHNPVLDRAMPALSWAADYSGLWLATAGLLAASGRPAWRRAAARAVVSTVLASGAANGLGKLTVGRRRPPLEDVPLSRRLRHAPVTTSFPSGHSASAAAFATAIAVEAPELSPPVALLAAGVASSRVWTGAHYPGDVVVGGALGVAVTLSLAPVRRRATFRASRLRLADRCSGWSGTGCRGRRPS
jgi:membrane-associated phospholipid phosphatase